MKRYLRVRREINRALAEKDRANRCAVCFDALIGTVYVAVEDPDRKFCSPECRDQALGMMTQRVQ